MNNTKTNKRGLSAIFALAPAAHWLLVISIGFIALHLLLRKNYPLMQKLSQNVVRPLHRSLSLLCSKLDFSVAELIITLLIVSVLMWLAVQCVRLFSRGGKWRRIYHILISLLALTALIYALFSLLWGVFFYGDSFIAASGLKSDIISTEDLELVTVYFADHLNEYGALVERDANGLYTADRADILRRSAHIFDSTETLFPCLDGPDIPVKGIRFSRYLSYLDFTGFFFPFTGEANVNTHSPVSMFASTVAHELSHQRGVAREQEANFVAVLACLNSGDLDYCYSACMLAYTHLGNALYSADNSAWRLVYRGLSLEVQADLEQNRSYWQDFETPVQTVSNTVYEGLLQSYDQKLGLKSYGACVDLLVNYYVDEARARFVD